MITGDSTGTGSGSFQYSVAPWGGQTTRIGTIKVNDQVFTVEQMGMQIEGCDPGMICE